MEWQEWYDQEVAYLDRLYAELKGMSEVNEMAVSSNLCDQTKLHQASGDGLAKVNELYSLKKCQYEEKWSEEALKIRKSDGKITEGLVNDTLVTNGEIKTIRREVISVRARKEKWESLYDSVASRAHLLRTLANVLMNSYVSPSGAKGDKPSDLDLAKKLLADKRAEKGIRYGTD